MNVILIECYPRQSTRLPDAQTRTLYMQVVMDAFGEQQCVSFALTKPDAMALAEEITRWLESEEQNEHTH